MLDNDVTAAATRRYAARRAIALVATAAFAIVSLPPVGTAQTALPSLGDAGGDDLSPLDERRLGERAMAEIRREPEFFPDPDATDYVQQIGYQLVAASPARHIDFNFFLIRENVINAFALPGGFIGVNTGLILTAQSESELAAVMAHEIGHVDQRHIARMLAKQRDSTLIALGSLLLALIAARGGASSGPGFEAALTVGQAAAIQNQLNFSREAEREADRVGFQTMGAAGFDVHAMPVFFERLQQGSRVYESSAPSYLRTHPLTTERIADMQARVGGTRSRQRPDSLDFFVVRARLRALADDSKQGMLDAYEYFTNQVRLRTAPSMTAAQYGLALSALRLNKYREAVTAATAARNSSLAPSAMLDKIVSETRFAAASNDAERDAALQLARDAAARYPLSRLTAIHYANLLQRAQRHDQTVTFLRQQLALTRTDPTYFGMLAASYGALQKHTLEHQALAELYVLRGSTPAAVDQLQLARKAGDADFYVLSEVDARMRELKTQLRELREENRKSGRRQPDEDRPDKDRPDKDPS